MMQTGTGRPLPDLIPCGQFPSLKSADAAGQAGAPAAHDRRDIEPAGKSNVSVHALPHPAEMQPVSLPDPERGVHRNRFPVHLRLSVPARDGNECRSGKLQFRSAESELQRRFILRVIRQKVAQPERPEIHGASRRKPLALIPGSPRVLDSRERPGGNHSESHSSPQPARLRQIFPNYPKRQS